MKDIPPMSELNVALLEENEALEARVAELEQNAARYLWMQKWFIQCRPRWEIDPIGHIRFTTAEIMNANIDAQRQARGQAA